MLTQPSLWIHRPAAVLRARARGAAGALRWRRPAIINTPFGFTSTPPLPHGAYWAGCNIKCVLNRESGAV